MAHVHRWVARHLPGTAHERRVMGLALAMFGLLQPVHRLPLRYRRLLKIAALLHDVGRGRSPKRHHLHGARLILKSRRLRVTAEERAFAAYAARHHRGPIPTRRADEAFFDGQAREMRVLLAILRAADALDKRRLAPPTVLLKRNGHELRITLIPAAGTEASWRKAVIRRKMRMLREGLDVAITVRLRVRG